jgi:CubicO group peptidase (beta-lactamase class C family)
MNMNERFQVGRRQRLFALGVLLSFVFLVPSDGTAQSMAETLAETLDEKQGSTKQHALQIERLLDRYFDYGQLNGTVLVVEAGETIFRQGFGMANREWDIPNGPDTKYRIGSVTKQFTAALVLQLVEQGEIELSAPITRYLTDYRKETGDKVTVHQLLCHTSGVPSYTTPEFFEKHSRESYELTEFVQRFASGDLEFEPGSEYAYSNSGYHLLGAIIEKVTGQTYAEVLRENILKPVGMSDSGFDVTAAILKKRAQGYSTSSGGYRNAEYLDMGIPYSAGSMYSTVDDLRKWVTALRTDQVLSAESKQRMYSPNLRNYGYGVDISERETGEDGETTTAISHGGGINGFHCLLSNAVEQDHVVVILDNVEQGGYHEDITNAIFDILNDRPFQGARKSIADELYRMVKEGGAAMVAKYRALKNDQSDTYDFDSEEALNRLGYQLLGNDKVEDAIVIFKLNVELFPNAFNAYDSLGEAYLKNHQRELALASYRKSVELNPESQSGIMAIQELESSESPR